MAIRIKLEAQEVKDILTRGESVPAAQLQRLLDHLVAQRQEVNACLAALGPMPTARKDEDARLDYIGRRTQLDKTIREITGELRQLEVARYRGTPPRLVVAIRAWWPKGQRWLMVTMIDWQRDQVRGRLPGSKVEIDAHGLIEAGLLSFATGALDKDGVPIYEGDLVDFGGTPTPTLTQCCWLPEHCQYGLVDAQCHVHLLLTSQDTCQVRGDILQDADRAIVYWEGGKWQLIR